MELARVEEVEQHMHKEYTGKEFKNWNACRDGKQKTIAYEGAGRKHGSMIQLQSRVSFLKILCLFL